MNDDLNPVEQEPVAQEPESNGETPPDLLWIREGSDFVVSTVYIYQDPITRRLKNVMAEQAQFLKENGMLEYPVETRWTVPTRSQLEGYRNSSAKYNPIARAVMFQRALVEELLVKNHLQEIILGPEGHRTSMVIQRDSKGRLTKESQEIVDQLHPSVMDMSLAKFIDDAALMLF